jgi:hypothetical protein
VKRPAIACLLLFTLFGACAESSETDDDSSSGSSGAVTGASSGGDIATTVTTAASSSASGSTSSGASSASSTSGSGGAGGATGSGGAGATTGSGGAGGGVCAGSTAVMINEVDYDTAGGDNGNEWVELYNASGASVDISGWKLQAGTSSYGTIFTFPAATSIAATSYVVVGGSNVGGATFNSGTALNMGNAGASADAVRLVTDLDVVIDSVVYGAPQANSDNWLDDCGNVATSYAPGVGFSSEVIARSPNGVDTNLGSDFVVTGTATLGGAN